MASKKNNETVKSDSKDKRVKQSRKRYTKTESLEEFGDKVLDQFKNLLLGGTGDQSGK